MSDLSHCLIEKLNENRTVLHRTMYFRLTCLHYVPVRGQGRLVGLRANCGSNRTIRFFACWRPKQPLKLRIPLKEMLINLFWL
jgi:hypothetical protein